MQPSQTRCPQRPSADELATAPSGRAAAIIRRASNRLKQIRQSAAAAASAASSCRPAWRRRPAGALPLPLSAGAEGDGEERGCCAGSRRVCDDKAADEDGAAAADEPLQGESASRRRERGRAEGLFALGWTAACCQDDKTRYRIRAWHACVLMLSELQSGCRPPIPAPSKG